MDGSVGAAGTAGVGQSSLNIKRRQTRLKKLWQWDENGTAAQQWEIIEVGGGYYKIVARHSGKVLDVAGVSTADGAQIHQWDYVGGSNQQWLLRLVP